MGHGFLSHEHPIERFLRMILLVFTMIGITTKIEEVVGSYGCEKKEPVDVVAEEADANCERASRSKPLARRSASNCGGVANEADLV